MTNTLQQNRDLNMEYDDIYQEWASVGCPDRNGDPVHYDAAPLEAIVTPWYMSVKR